MDNTSGENGQGTIITLADLEAKPALISHEQHQWTACLARVSSEPRLGRLPQCAEIWYTNPEFIDIPNQICFHFPAFDQVIGCDSEIMVCLHPSLAELVVQGLYFQGDEDWHRFWPPLRQLL